MDTDKKFEMDESDVTLEGTVHWLQADPGLMPKAADKTWCKRQPTGGKKPYTYTVDKPGVAHVDDQGIVIALTTGKVRVTVTEKGGQSKSYLVTISNGHSFFAFGSGRLGNLKTDADRERVRLATLDDLKVLHQRFGHVWQLGSGQFWSTTASGETAEPPPPPPFGTGDNYFTKDVEKGDEQTNDSGHVFNALGRHL